MANIKSQIKRNKQNELRRQRNQAVKSRLKTAVRKFRELSEAGDKDAAVAAGRDAMKQLDKAASKGVIHANQAANRKSSIAKKAAAL
ncbi:30S ribosomal protein S20 [Nocardioides sp. SYSU D00065]|uniref:30S ribosomal protein S20 n=1 Tax=Nocardioides sp. SYSU D00065 TaxID=2817378 RepID=UPI001B325C3E|nr:30S ribosomal protein S20 [Nocardioides sp. SYSU D00065]